jgi:transposase
MASASSGLAVSPAAKRQPRREKLPEHLGRIEHHHESADTTCACGQAMHRVREDVSERLDIIPGSSACTATCAASGPAAAARRWCKSRWPRR